MIADLDLCLDEQICLYQELLSLAKQGESLTDNEDLLINIQELLGKRSEKIAQIHQVQEQLVSLCRDIAKSIGYEKNEINIYEFVPLVSKNADQKVQEIARLIKEIQTKDEQLSLFISEKVEGIKQKIKKVQVGIKSNKAYEPSTIQGEGVFIDQKIK